MRAKISKISGIRKVGNTVIHDLKILWAHRVESNKKIKRTKRDGRIVLGAFQMLKELRESGKKNQACQR